MVVVLDYDMGNTGSVVNMLRRIGVDAVCSKEPSIVERADKILLPGVGSFDAGVSKLRHAEWFPILQERVLTQGVPFLGICLGMQLLFNESEEGVSQGLGWIEGTIRRFNFTSPRVPHMGWNTVRSLDSNSLLLSTDDDLRFYFVHSYHAVCRNNENILALTTHGYEFASIVQAGNIFGMQFHPEKSHLYGMEILKRFANI